MNTENMHHHIHLTQTITILVIILLFTLIYGWQNQRLSLSVVGREILKHSTAVQTFNLPCLKSPHFVVKYYPGDKEQAQLVLEAAEKFIDPVSQKLGYQLTEQITVVVYPTREKLNKFFGWPADESAMGVYWCGTIRVLAPREWVGTSDSHQARELFFNSGPMAHEIAHLVLDYRTQGNYTRWFTEGVAQYVELTLTGFRFREPTGALDKQRYTFEQLTNQFDQLPNQSLAYRQSLAAIYFLVEQYGNEALNQVLNALSAGQSIDYALQQVCGVTIQQFENQLNNWLNINGNIFS